MTINIPALPGPRKIGKPQLACDHVPNENSSAVNSEREDTKLCKVMVWCIYTYCSGWTGGNPIDIQDTLVRHTRLLTLSVCLNKKVSANSAQGVGPNANSNNYPEINVEAEEAHTVDATTGFTSDANVAASRPNVISYVDKLLQSSSSTGFMQDIATFLAKPTILQANNLSIADVIGTPLFVNNMPQDGLVNALYADKIRGFLGIRCTTCIRWQINGNRFQQGRYMLLVVPLGGSPITNAGTALTTAAHLNNLPQRTQVFRVELDVNCDTEGSLEIPFNSSLNFIPLASLNTGIPTFGHLFNLSLYPYSPLVAPTGSTVAAYTVWVSFKDVELIGPAQPQSGRMNVSKRGKSSTEKEQDSAGIGPVTSALIKVSSASSALSAIPLIRDYATGVGWLTNIMSKATYIFGWSKPLNLAVPHRVTREVLPWFGNIDAPDQSQPLSLLCQNQVQVMPGFSGTDVDEMDFSFFKTIPCWNMTVPWPELSVAGARLFSIMVAPYVNLISRVDGAGSTVYDFCPHQLIANYFCYWRGAMVYTIKFVKTEFHSGRLAFVFSPYDTQEGAGPARTLATSAYTHREIVDIRLCNEVTFEVPFLSSSPWRSTRGTATHTGFFECYVVDALVAPATVSGTVTMLLEHSAGPDMEFAVPYSNPLIPAMNIVPQSGSMNMPRDDCELVSGTLGSASVTDANCLNCAATIGESITSFRSMLKMTNVLGSNGAFVYTASLNTIVVPFAWSPLHNLGATERIPNTVGDLYTVLCSVYCYSRGGVRLKFLDQVTSSTTTPAVTYHSPFLGGGTLADVVTQSATDGNGVATLQWRTVAPQVFHNIVQNQSSEVQIPQYHRWHSRVNSECMATAIVPYSFVQNSLAPQMVVTHHFPVITNTVVCRAGSEDTNFGTFISVPPMFVSTTTSVL